MEEDVEGVDLIRITAPHVARDRVDVFRRRAIEYSTLMKNRIVRSCFVKCYEENDGVDVSA